MEVTEQQRQRDQTLGFITTCLALLVWSVGHLTGGYRHEQLYSRLIEVLSGLAVGGILVFAGYLIAQ
jgi:uncharacterized membrane protein (UPF0136 family)